MKFQASDNLIDLFVGQLIYTTPAASVRELLQNAYDACALQSVDHSDFKPSITAMISRSGNWFEVDDNGIGMDHDIVEQSFSMVGSPKSEYDRFVPYKGYKMRFRRILLGFRIVDEHFEAHRLYKETSEIRKDPAFTQKTFQNFLRLIVLWKELLPEQQENVIQWFVDFHMGS